LANFFAQGTFPLGGAAGTLVQTMTIRVATNAFMEINQFEVCHLILKTLGMKGF
jgi:hypothetical protein